MIRIMVLDDEPPALRQIERVLGAFPNVQICGLFTDPDELFQQLEAGVDNADLLLLDMEMPEMHGLTVSRKLQLWHEDLSVVFVTAYDEYAVQAFEVDALDYLLKPVCEERMAKTLNRFSQKRARLSPSNGQSGGKRGPSVFISSFGRFVIRIGGREATFVNSKSEELLAYLVHHSGEPVGKAEIIEALWPNRDLERAQANLYSTVYQLRKDLAAHGLNEAIEQSRRSGGSYRFSFSKENFDVGIFGQLYSICKDERFDPVLAEKALAKYRSGYLSAHDYTWAAPRREELESHYTQLLEKIATDHVRHERYQQAWQPLQTVVDLYPFNEDIHAKMIALYLLQRRTKEATAYLTKVEREIFIAELGIGPALDYARIAANPYALFS